MESRKENIRKRVWSLLTERGVASFPPPWGRIPNFRGAEKAATLLRELKIYKEARVVSVNPDSPQRPIREMVLRDGKILLMGTPRLRKGFVIIKNIKGYEKEASTLSGARKYGKSISLKEIPQIDIKVVGSVAVTVNGGRIGKGKGLFDIGYSVLRELKVLDELTPIVTTVHELQIVKKVPMEEHDVPVDIIITPKRIIETNTSFKKPTGIPWTKITKKFLDTYPILTKLRV
jgi:5-formyltetrahydrofolate cyclo-ligase